MTWKMTEHGRRLPVGQLLFATALVVGVVLYYFDARGTSTSVQNLILIAPFTVVALGLYALIIFNLLCRRGEVSPAGEERDGAGDEDLSMWQRAQPIVILTLVGLYVFTMERVGFDVATVAFVAATLVVQGERNVLRLTAFSIAFSALVVWGAKSIFTSPVPTLFGPIL